MRLLACAALITLLTAGAARAERFRYRFTPSRPIENRISLAGASMMGLTAAEVASPEMSKMQFRMQLRQVMRVRSVSGGVATLDVTETPVTSTMIADGRREALKRPPERYTLQLTDRGRFVGRKDQPAEGSGGAEPQDGVQGPAADVLNHATALNFPDRDLKPGDSWEADLSTGEDGHTARAVWKYVGKELFRGRPCVKITTQLTSRSQSTSEEAGVEIPADNRVSASITTWFDPKEGVEVYSRGSIVVMARTDMSSVQPGVGAFAVITKINYVQSLVPSGGPAKSK